jgi:hypothetical protein
MRALPLCALFLSSCILKLLSVAACNFQLVNTSLARPWHRLGDNTEIIICSSRSSVSEEHCGPVHICLAVYSGFPKMQAICILRFTVAKQGELLSRCWNTTLHDNETRNPCWNILLCNKSIGQHQCNNDLSDVARRIPLDCQRVSTDITFRFVLS